VFVAGVFSATVSATIGNASLCLGGAASWADFGRLWFTWWLGDGAGALVVAPLLITWIEDPPGRWTLRRAAEALLLLVSLTIAVGIVFGGLLLPALDAYPLEHLIIPFLLWAAFRFGPREGATAITVVTGIAIWGTKQGFGPFARQDQNESLLLLQVFVAAVAITVLILAAIVAERKQAGQELFENRERLRLAMEASKMGTWTRELDESNITRWSPELEQIFGLRPGEFPETEEAFFEFVHPDDRAAVRDAVAHAIDKHTDYAVEFRYTPKGGNTRWMMGRGRAFYDDSGKPVRLAGLGWDITERKQAEQERERLLALEQNARVQAEAANRMKDEFLATVSHELRTPLNAILGWATILRRGIAGKGSESSAVETIERNARSQAQLIEDLLDVSRITSGKLRLEVGPADLISVIKSAIESIRHAADAKEIQLQMILDPAVSPYHGDAGRLQQVIWNLLSNAVKFTPKGGLVQVRLDRADSKAAIMVSDTGEGISPDFLPYVFDRFQQADGSITRKHGGLGLGLAIARHIIEMHGGTITAESAGPGKGARFTVSLPLIAVRKAEKRCPEDSAPAEVDSASPPQVLSRLRILAVDDEPDTRAMLESVLEQYGADVITASTAGEAADLLPGFRPDILVCDIGMPGEDGFSLIRRVRALGPEQGGNTPAIALTGYVRVEERMRALDAGYQMFVPKPVEGDELVSIIAGLVRRTGWVASDT
jgi:PAS domain S-box-containing protein